MPKNSNFCLFRGHRFGQKIEFTVMAPNDVGDTLGSILGPIGSHLGQKMGQNSKKITMPQNQNFLLLGGLRFWPQDGPYGIATWFGAITVNSIFCPNRCPRSSQKFEFWDMVIFYGFDPFFLPKWDPIGPKMDPRGSPSWFGAKTINSIFCPNRRPRSSQKFEF